MLNPESTYWRAIHPMGAKKKLKEILEVGDVSALQRMLAHGFNDNDLNNIDRILSDNPIKTQPLCTGSA